MVPFLLDFILAFIVAVGFGVLFNVPKRALLIAGLLGGLGHVLRYTFHDHLGYGIVASTLIGTVTIGLSGIYFAHKIHTPPVVFTMPACITMIPGLFAYRTMMGLIKITGEKTGSENGAAITSEILHNFVLTTALLFALAIGISISALLFRKSSVKNFGDYSYRDLIRKK